MLKRGFTLAEVLITLTIIGVVATLTTPALVKNVGSSKIGPQLAKFVNTWETAAEQLMTEESVGSLRAAITEGTKKVQVAENAYEEEVTSNLLDVMSKHMIMSSLKNTTGPSALTSMTGAFSTGYVWQLKDGTIIAYVDRMQKWSNASGNWLGGSLIVDIGGMNGKHRAGKEVFKFIMTDEGYLIPFGSNAFKSKVGDVVYKKLTCGGEHVGSEWACTGAVADNGYKAPW